MPTAVYQQYPNRAVYVTSGDANATDQTISGAIQQLSRVQSLSWAPEYPLNDAVYVDAGIDSYRPTPPTVNVSLEWWNTNGANERYIGLVRFNHTGQLVVGFDEERSMYVAFQADQGLDAINASTTAPRTVLGLAQGLLTSYQLSAQVGGLIESRATLNYLTAVIYSGASGLQAPVIDPRDGSLRTGRFVLPAAASQFDLNGSGLDSVAALSASEMVMIFPEQTPFGVVFTGAQACFLQSVQLGINITRQALKPLGYAYPSDRPVVWPVPVDLVTEAIVGTYQADQLRRLTCTVTGQSAYLVVKQPCSNLTTFGFYFGDLQVTSQQFAESIGAYDRVTTTWRGWLRTPDDAFINPFYNYLIRLDTSGAWGTTW